MSNHYCEAESVKEIADKLIPEYHPELATAVIGYVFAEKASKSNGQPVLGKARKVSGVWNFLTGFDFMLEVAGDCWNDLTLEQRGALVDHLLETCTGEEAEDGSMVWKTRKPEVQEFASIIERHGAWMASIEELVQVAKQINLERLMQEVAEEDVPF